VILVEKPYQEIVMTMMYANHLKPDTFTQAEKLPGTNQEQNSAGGYTYVLDDFGQMARFLILGTEGGTYYASEKKLTRENAACVERCLAKNSIRAIDLIVDISVNGRAPKNDPAIFALALAASYNRETLNALHVYGPEDVRKYALSHLNAVCRTGTHLFQFVEACEVLRGWGKGLRNAVGNWYTEKTSDSLAYQLTKYQQRNGWSHRDVLRKAHVTPKDKLQDALFRYVITGKPGDRTFGRVVKRKNQRSEPAIYGPVGYLPDLIVAVEEAKKATEASEIARLIRDKGLVREVIPTQFLNDLDVWDALLRSGKGMPITAMVRNLGKMTSIGLLKTFSEGSKHVIETLTNPEILKASRIHPIALLMAHKIYAQGHGDKGSLIWTPNPLVANALEHAFYASFGHVEPTGKRFVIGVDVSGSMTWTSSKVVGTPFVAREAAAAMAMVIARTEPWCFIGGFHDSLVDLKITALDSLDSVMKKMGDCPAGPTDCAVPILWADKQVIQADCFVTMTDCETWAGKIHPSVALKNYRKKTGIFAKNAVFGFSATNVTIADPKDAGSMDFVGLDSATPQVLSEFVKG